VNDYRDPRVREQERLKFALDTFARHLDEFVARLGTPSVEVSVTKRAAGRPAHSPDNGFASQIVSAMDRFRLADQSAR
jgi:hypothetical protein